MVVTRELELETRANTEIIDITQQVQENVALSKISNGTVTVFITGSTTGITTIEYEPGLLADFKNMWERSVPRNIPYNHDRAWGESNGHSHVRASILGPSLVIPFSNKKLMLGTWQQIIVIDFDIKPRTRRIILQIMGE